MSTYMNTAAGELGQLAGEAISDLVFKATGSGNIATYADGPAPISWNVIAEGGWDQIGIYNDGEGATLRDLVSVARAWGHGGIQLPLMPSILAKRHSPLARAVDGPVTLALPSAALVTGRSYIPYGQDEVAIAANLGSENEALVDVPVGVVPDSLGITLRGIEADLKSVLSLTASRETAVVLAAETVGGAQRMLSDAVAFAKERNAFGKPIGSFQAVKHHLANALIAVEMADTATIWASQQEADAFRGASFAIDQSIKVAELAIQVHGGLGFTWEMGLHFYLRHMLVAREVVQGLKEQHQSPNQ